MKRIIFSLLILSCGLVAACIPEETVFSTEANRPGKKPEETPDNPDVPENPDIDYKGIDPRLFEVINMDAPGLEAMKAQYQEGDMYGAAAALKEYYRTRTSVVNPAVNLSDKTITASAKSVADQALEHRFYTMSNTEGTGPDGFTLYYDADGADGKISWEKAPDGVLDKEEYLKQIHRFMWMPYQARAYHASGDEKYVRSILEVYDDYMSKYPVPSGKGSGTAWTGLQISQRLLGWLEVLPYIAGAESFTPEWLAKMTVHTHDALECLRKTWYTPSSSNIYFAQVQALIQNAMFFPEFTMGPEWFEDGISLVTSQLSEQFNSDGVQNELDVSYHLGVVANFEEIQNFAVANGRTQNFPSNYTSMLKGSCRFVMDSAYPDYTFENFNDTRSARTSKSVTLRNLGTYCSMFPDDQELLYMASDRTKGTAPKELVQKYPVSGWYMMRSGWGPQDMMLIHKNNNDPADHWHCQGDNGTVSLWYKGRRFLPDAGTYTYTSGSTRDSFAAAANHNTLTRNKASLAAGRRMGKLLQHVSTAGYELLVTENASYSDLTHRRAIFMVDKAFFVIVDEGYGKAEAPVNVQWYLCADEKGSLAENAAEFDDLTASHAYGAHTVFSDGNNMAFRTFPETSQGFAAETGLAWCSNDIDTRYQRRYYRITVDKASDKAARFITVIYPVSSEVPEIQASFTDNSAGAEGTFHAEGASVKVTIGGTEYNLTYSL